MKISLAGLEKHWVPGFLNPDTRGIQIWNSNEVDSGNSQQSYGESTAQHSGTRQPDFDRVFKTSMSSRNIGDGNSVLMANGYDILGIRDMELNNVISCQGNLYSAMFQKTVVSGEGTHTQPTNNNVSQYDSITSPINTDPFNLGPVIAKVMAQSYCSTVGSGLNSGKTPFGKTKKAGERKGAGKRFQLPDLNVDVGDLSRFRLNQYLMNKTRRTRSKRKVRSKSRQDTNTSSASLQSQN